MEATFAISTHGFDRLTYPRAAGENAAGRDWSIGKALLLHAALLTLLIGSLWGRSVAPGSVARGSINVDLIAPSSLSAAMQHTLNPPTPTPVPEPLPVAPPDPALPEPVPAEVEPVDPATVSETPPAPSTAAAVIPKPQTAGGEAGSTGAGEEFKADPKLAEQVFGDRRLRVLQIHRENRARQTFAATKSVGPQGPRTRTRAGAQTDPWIRPQRNAAVDRAASASVVLDPAASITVDPSTWPDASDDADEAALRSQYEEALRAAILAHWIAPAGLPLDQPCRVVIERARQPGVPAQVRVDDACPLDESGRASIREAIEAAQPLPHEGFEVLQAPALQLDFRRQVPTPAPSGG